jgi:hypothetical protein
LYSGKFSKVFLNFFQNCYCINGWLSLRVPAEDDEWLQNQPVWPWLALARGGYLQPSHFSSAEQAVSVCMKSTQ